MESSERRRTKKEGVDGEITRGKECLYFTYDREDEAGKVNLQSIVDCIVHFPPRGLMKLKLRLHEDLFSFLNGGNKLTEAKCSKRELREYRS